MKTVGYFFFVLFLLAGPFTVGADTIRLKNGDQISGDIVEETAETFILQTDAMGVVVVKKEFIPPPEETTAEMGEMEHMREASHSTEILQESEETAQQLEQAQQARQAEQAEQTPSQETPPVGQNLRTAQTAHVQESQPSEGTEKNKTPEPNVQWERKISIGYSQAGGNTERNSSTSALNINRKTERNETTAKYTSYYASSRKKTYAKKFYSMLRYAYNFGAWLKWYNFYKIEADQNRFANIEARFVPSSGIGYWFFDKPPLKAMLEGAVGHQYTNYHDPTKSKGEAILVPRGFLEKTLFESLILSQDASFYPSLRDTDQYRFHSETAVQHPVSKNVTWKMSFIDDYNSLPQGVTRKNDYRMISSIDYSF